MGTLRFLIGSIVSRITSVAIKVELNLIRRLLIHYFKWDTYMNWWSIVVDDDTKIRMFIDRADKKCRNPKPVYIERDAALRGACASLCHPGPRCPDGYCKELNTLKMIPNADVRENVHAEWRKISSSSIYRCSSCGYDVLTNDITNFVFCHRCGAKMDARSLDGTFSNL